MKLTILLRPRQKYLPHPLSKGAIGAGLSHLDAWRKIAASDAPMALILEDDAILDKDLDDILHQLSLLEDRIDIVNLHFRGGRPLTNIIWLSGLITCLPVDITALAQKVMSLPARRPHIWPNIICQ